ncbi:MAG TPA: hypothetical protein VKC51_07510 [Lacunisphaera sp.]|nr:hypothetical protein [Lacunisphaera sp.]
MRPRLAETPPRWRGWLIPAALLALAPKCVLCALAYAGLGVALGLGGPEICGASGGAAGHWTAWLLAPGLAVGAAGIFCAQRRRRV